MQSLIKPSQGHRKNWLLLSQGWGQINFWRRFSVWYHFYPPQRPNSQPRLAPNASLLFKLGASAPFRGQSSQRWHRPVQKQDCTVHPVAVWAWHVPWSPYSPSCPTGAWEGDIGHGWSRLPGQASLACLCLSGPESDPRCHLYLMAPLLLCGLNQRLPCADVAARLVALLHHSLFCDYNIEILLLIIKCLIASVTEIKI